ncbi:hypothetical protein [Conexibacter sp. SYSU D00693]|uniref:hypothetical protein n=1 Tax=Conexibacter sp. SYSU D00693 TaxID=2812560 RepID=UPI00196AC4C6|nr:hypothetical protein [Conexibacter sp. SYSU D00693]
MRGRLLAAAIATVAALAAPSAAQAGLLVETAKDCSQQSLDKTFLPWLDIANYTTVPGGDFEEGSDHWGATHGASVVDGNEPFNVLGDGHTSSLRLEPGASVTSPAMCVGLGHPTLRLFAKSSGTVPIAGLLDHLRVDVLLEDTLGLLYSLPIGTILRQGQWAPTPPVLVVGNLLPLLPGLKTPIAFRFTAVGTSTWQIDDVQVDPYKSR